MDRSAAYQAARHKSLYGHRSWLAWRAISGEWHGERFYAFSNGTAFAQTPKLAALRLANMGYC